VYQLSHRPLLSSRRESYINLGRKFICLRCHKKKPRTQSDLEVHLEGKHGITADADTIRAGEGKLYKLLDVSLVSSTDAQAQS
jgi:hypothetical protein